MIINVFVIAERLNLFSCLIINNFLQLSLDLYYTEDEIYELSLLREPRNPKSLVRLLVVVYRLHCWSCSY